MVVIKTADSTVSMALTGNILTVKLFTSIMGVFSEHPSAVVVILKSDAEALFDSKVWPTTLENKIGGGSLAVSKEDDQVNLTFTKWSGGEQIVSLQINDWPTDIDSLN